MCSKFNHTPCGRSCACAVACLHPHNSISNVVVSVTIHDDMKIFTGRSKTLLTEHHGKCLTCKSFVKLGFCLCVSVYVSVSLCVACCVLLWWRSEGGWRRGQTNRTIWLLIPARASRKIAETEQLHQAQRMIGGIGNVLFSIYSQTENV